MGLDEMINQLNNLKEIREQLDTKDGFWLDSKVTLNFKGNLYPRQYVFDFDRGAMPIFFEDFRKDVAQGMNKAFRENITTLIERLEGHIKKRVKKELGEEQDK